MMDMYGEQRDGAYILGVRGRIDESTHEAFADRLIECVKSDLGKVIICLAEVTYMSSRALRALFRGHRAARDSGSTIILAEANVVVREILSISRTDRAFAVTESVEAALAI